VRKDPVRCVKGATLTMSLRLLALLERHAQIYFAV
jgi:hypothetical protein